jgi:predicted ABC-type ATPase
MELAVARIRHRVAEGGHDVPLRDVRRRFNRSVGNFFRVYRPLLDSWTLFDNSTTRPSVVAEEKGGKLAIVDATLFAKISKTVED